LLGAAVALAGPAVFGVLAAPGGIELNAKEMALAFGIGALIFWTVVSYFSGAGALGAFAAFGTLIYCWHWIPNRTTNFLNDVPGVTTGMIEGSRQYTLNGVVPILTVISLVYAIQLIVRSVQRRRRERAEAERLQREQEAAQAQQEAEAAALYPVAGSTYPAAGAGYGGTSSRYDDLFDEDPEPVQPRSQAEEQTRQLPVEAPEQTAQFPAADNDARSNDSGDETVAVPTDRDETTQVPVEQSTPPQPTPEPQDQQPVAKAPQPTTEADEPPTAANDDDTVAAPAPDQQKPEQSAPVAEGPEKKAEARAAGGPQVKEQVGQQYRERMENPEDTGELYLSAFENPQMSIRPAGA
jgi:heme exporter protein D